MPGDNNNNNLTDAQRKEAAEAAAALAAAIPAASKKSKYDILPEYQTNLAAGTNSFEKITIGELGLAFQIPKTPVHLNVGIEGDKTGPSSGSTFIYGGASYTSVPPKLSTNPFVFSTSLQGGFAEYYTKYKLPDGTTNVNATATAPTAAVGAGVEHVNSGIKLEAKYTHPFKNSEEFTVSNNEKYPDNFISYNPSDSLSFRLSKEFAIETIDVSAFVQATTPVDDQIKPSLTCTGGLAITLNLGDNVKKHR